MKTTTLLITLIFALIIFLLHACKKEDKTNYAPSCNITSLSNGNECILGEIYIISVEANDSDGNIEEICFYVDNIKKGTENSSPCNFTWNTEGEALGEHVLKATCTDNDGNTKSDEITVNLISSERAEFTASPLLGDAPLTVSFTDQSTSNPTSWLWDFGDGNTSTAQSPSHTYNEMGQYDVSLTATNQTDSYTKTIQDYIQVKGTFTDPRDDQTYKIVDIGNQTWFAENLNFETPNSYCYDDNPANGGLAGRLYQWADVLSACPDGWHAASDNEWKTLEMHLGMSQSDADDFNWRGTDEGAKLKSATAWPGEENNTNEVGFTAIPSGSRNPDGNFFFFTNFAAYWTITEEGTNGAIYRYLEVDEIKIGRSGYNKQYGYSIRCIKN